MTDLVLVAAMGRSREIGANNALLWHLPEDLAHFKAITLGKPVLMGRKTLGFAAAAFSPLPGRRNLVLTRGAAIEGAETVRSLDEALALCADAPELCVIGGAQLYALALPLAQRLELTEIDAEYAQADTWFPALDAGWHQESGPWQPSAGGLRYRFLSASRDPR